jgi:ribosome-associated protein
VKVPAVLRKAAQAALDKKAGDVVVLDLRKSEGITDHFLLASGGNQKQLVAIADAVMEALRKAGLRPRHLEGYPRHEWILADYGDFVVHVFTPRMRVFYDLERLWGGAQRTEIGPSGPPREETA